MKKVFDDGINNIIVSIPDSSLNIEWWRDISYDINDETFSFKTEDNFNHEYFEINSFDVYKNNYIIIDVNTGRYILPVGSELISISEPSLIDNINEEFVAKHHRPRRRRIIEEEV